MPPREDKDSDVIPQIAINSWTEDDLPFLRRIQGDADMMRHLGGPESAAKIADRLQRYIRLWAPDGRMFKVLYDGNPAGSVGYWERTWQGKTIYEMGWSVLPEFQGHGIATRATELAIERAKQDGLQKEIHAFPSTQNEPSNRLCRKLGFTLEGEHDFEYPPEHSMRCNDWAFEL